MASKFSVNHVTFVTFVNFYINKRYTDSYELKACNKSCNKSCNIFKTQNLMAEPMEKIV